MIRRLSLLVPTGRLKCQKEGFVIWCKQVARCMGILGSHGYTLLGRLWRVPSTWGHRDRRLTMILVFGGAGLLVVNAGHREHRFRLRRRTPSVTSTFVLDPHECKVCPQVLSHRQLLRSLHSCLSILEIRVNVRNAPKFEGELRRVLCGQEFLGPSLRSCDHVPKSLQLWWPGDRNTSR